MISVNVKGIADLRRTMNRLPAELMKRAEAPVLRAGAKPIHKAAKSKVQVGDEEHPGLLRRSLGISVKKVGGILSARVGARTGFKKSIGAKLARKTKGKRVKGRYYQAFKDPAKYIHLVELGTSHSAAKPFIRPAIDSSRGEVINAMSNGLEKYLHNTAKRLAKKANR